MIIFKFNVITDRLISMFMKISFNLCFIVNIRNLMYCIDLWCSHNTKGQICQESSVNVKIGTRLEKQVLISGFLDVFMALRCTTLHFVTLYFS